MKRSALSAARDARSLHDGLLEERRSVPGRRTALHQVWIEKAFEIGRYEVTQDDWLTIMKADPSNFNAQTVTGWADHPVEQVSWNDVQDFMQKLNDRHDGYHYRLPTEAEWEYVARAGTDTPHGIPGGMNAWHGGNSGGQTQQIGTKLPNMWGLYDTEGNVWEWVQDWYDPGYYKDSPPADPPGPESGRGRVMRGGGVEHIAERRPRIGAHLGQS